MMDQILSVLVRLNKTIHIGKATVVYFSGEAHGRFFNGNVCGTGADVQIEKSDGVSLSARYILEGSDYTGEKCRIYVENNKAPNEDFTRPYIITDSAALKKWESARLYGKIRPSDDGVIIDIFMENT